MSLSYEERRRRRRAIGPIEVLVVLTFLAVLLAVAWSRLGGGPPQPNPALAAADSLAIEMVTYQERAVRMNHTYVVSLMPGSAAGPAYYAISRVIVPGEEKPLREVSLDAELQLAATPQRIEFRPDGSASHALRVTINSATHTSSIEVDAASGAVRLP